MDLIGIVSALQRGLLLLPLCLWSTACLLFWCGIPVSQLHLPLGVAVFASAQWLLRPTDKKAFLLSVLLPALWLLGSALYMGARLDISGDGRQYHQEAVIQLTLGWNPFYEALSPDVWDISWGVWLNALSKFGWVLGAVIAKGLGSIESAKCLTLYSLPAMALAGFLCAYRGFGLPLVFCVLAGGIACLNPIAAEQLCTSYSDGYTAAYGSIAVLTLLEFLKRRDREVETRLAMGLVLAFSSKFTNLYPALYLGVLLVLWGWRAWGLSDTLRSVRNLTIASGIAVVVMNANPYLSNLWRYGNLNYPMSTTYIVNSKNVGWARVLTQKEGLEKQIYSAHLPLNFHGKNRIHQFFYSLFSRSEHVASMHGTGAHLKRPWDARRSEWSYLAKSDGRICSLGPLFALLFVLSSVFLFFTARREPLLLLSGLALVAAAVSNPYGWWMRYIGFFFTYAFLGFVAAAIVFKPRKWPQRVACLAFALLTMLNSLPIFREHLGHSKVMSSQMLRTFKDELKKNGFGMMEAYYGGTRGYLSEHHYPFLTKEIEVRMAEAHLLSQVDPCIKHWHRWYGRSVPEDLVEDPKRRIWFFNLQGQFILRPNLSKDELLQAAECYSRISMRKYRVAPLWNPS